jgi:hypothetical protein
LSFCAIGKKVLMSFLMPLWKKLLKQVDAIVAAAAVGPR